MNIKNKTIDITLSGKKFKMKFDFETIANIQSELKKKGLSYKFTDLFKGIEEQDFSIIVPIVVHSIRRVHPQIEAHSIKDLLTLDESETIIEALVELIDASMPKNEEEIKKK